MPNTWSREFGALISSERKKNGLPLRKVAAALDIDTSTLSKIEKGERAATVKMIPVIAKLFDLDFRKLQIEYLSQKISDEFSNEMFFEDALNVLRNRARSNI